MIIAERKCRNGMRIIDEKRTKQKIVQKTFVLFLFIAYFVLGIFIYRDYGISTDEPNERESTFRNIKYVLDTFDIDTLHGADGDLENYRDRYYGVAYGFPRRANDLLCSPFVDLSIMFYRVYLFLPYVQGSI